MAEEPRRLGMQWEQRPGTPTAEPADLGDGGGVALAVNTRNSLWEDRWPAIAKQSCIDEVEAAPPSEQYEVKFNLPCNTCELASACLNGKRKEIGPLLYDREILTEPRSSESSLFPRSVFSPLLVKGSLARVWRPATSEAHHYRICQAWDVAWSEKTGGDYLVCMTGYVHLPTGQKRLIDIERWQAKSFDTQVDLIDSKHIQHGSDMVVLEQAAAQGVWKQRVASTSAVPVVSHNVDQKRDFREGVPGLLIGFSNRKWEIPWRPGTYHHEEVVNMLDEFQAFGWVDGKLEGVGEHDDTVMTFWHLDWGLNRMWTWARQGGTEAVQRQVQGARP